MQLDQDSCYQALVSRDPRFDGLIYVGVSSTGIYCRIVCPSRRPLKRNCSFFSTPAGAEQAGYRPCLRCRPELAPGNAWIDARSRIAVAISAIPVRTAHAAITARSTSAVMPGQAKRQGRDAQSGEHEARPDLGPQFTHFIRNLPADPSFCPVVQLMSEGVIEARLATRPEGEHELVRHPNTVVGTGVHARRLTVVVNLNPGPVDDLVQHVCGVVIGQ